MVEPKDDAAQASLVRVADQPPTVLPALVLGDLVPFPGPVVPISLDQTPRREAVLQAKNSSGFVLLINRQAVRKSSATLPSPLSLFTDEQEQEDESAEEDDDAGAERSGKTSESKKRGKMDAMRVEAELLNVAGEVEGDDQSMPQSLSALHQVGIVGRLLKVVRLGDDRITALVQLMRRAQPVELVGHDPCLTVRVHYPVEVVADEEQYEALFRQVRLKLQAFFQVHPTVSDELKGAALSIEAPATVADFVAQHLSRDLSERLDFLAELNLTKRMRRALEVTVRELDLLTVGNRISQEIREKVEKHQRDFLLREQLKAIRGELGEEKEPAALALQELRDKLAKAGLTKAARIRADEELKRLQLLPTESPEHNILRSYVEWIASLPWQHTTQDVGDIRKARKILDEDHYGLDEVKQRIVEFLAVHQLNPHKAGTLMCFSGPPGVGKTSLGQSIARAMGREFYRFSVGGMRDEAEIKGHRRTYIGAMPGRILQGLRQVKTANPVFMLDELDKMGSDWRGDPASALLEVLDPAQNKSFVDHYLDLPFDLSRVMFIATVNISTEIPSALRDRLEVIDLPGYIPEEKLNIALRYLLPRQRTEHGLRTPQLQVVPGALQRIVAEYTHEAGVRELDRQISKVCRKRAMQVVEGHKKALRVVAGTVPTYLGPPKIHDDRLTRRPVAGVSVGLAWTAAGGEVLFIEVAAMPGKGRTKVTGQLGEVMNESAALAFSYVKSRAKLLDIAPAALETQDFHIHFPAGAVKKDGPSAGVTITTALISLLKQQPIAPKLAMTGEMTLRGEVLSVGGVREKVVAARRAGVRTVILPARNSADVEEIPDYVRRQITFVFAASYENVLQAAFPTRKQPRRASRVAKSATKATAQRTTDGRTRRRAAKK